MDLEKIKNGSDSLVLKGIVYNEMKGAMSSISSQVDQGINENLFTNNHTYGFNSGGEPDEIPSLTYKGLVDFHKNTITHQMLYFLLMVTLILLRCKMRFKMC